MTPIDDKAHEECGVFGIYAPGEDVSRLTFYGLFALQHRGQESAGISTADGSTIKSVLDMGLVSQVFKEEHLKRLTGHIAIGHTRYSTSGSSALCNAQPINVSGIAGQIALAHNGNVVNAAPLHAELEEAGCEFNSTTDSEVIAQLIVRSPARTWPERLKYIMRRVTGAYSLVILTNDTLIGVRDPLGVRPLCLGKLGNGWVIASETCALDLIGAKYVREIEPGEAVIIDSKGLQAHKLTTDHDRKALCVFEYIYFARPDSVINNKLLYPVREAMGAELAREYPVDADIVVAVPDSATPAGLGYAQASGIPFTQGLIKNRYIGRTFIEPDQRLRDLGVQIKFNPLPEVIEGKRLVVVDDSIVRGTTTPHVVSILRKAGAKEVHLRVCAPPIKWPCYFGVDMATRRELIAAQKTIDEIRDFTGADSLGYLSIDGLVKAVGIAKRNLCMACFTGDYPIPVQLEMDKMQFENGAGKKQLLVEEDYKK